MRSIARMVSGNFRGEQSSSDSSDSDDDDNIRTFYRPDRDRDRGGPCELQ